MKALVGSPKPPPVAVQAPAPAVPDSDDSELRKARQRKIAESSARSGRASTFLSGDNDKLGA